MREVAAATREAGGGGHGAGRGAVHAWRVLDLCSCFLEFQLQIFNVSPAGAPTELCRGISFDEKVDIGQLRRYNI